MNLSTMQAAILADHAALPGAHQIAFAYHVTGATPIARFLAGLDGLSERYPLLRSTFSAAHGRTVHEHLPMPVALLDGGPEDLRARLAALAAQPFDLADGPPIRAAVGRIGPTEHVVLVVLHHVAYDAATIVPIAEHLCAAFGGAPAPAPWRDHAAFVEAERAWLAGPERDAALAQAHAELGGRALALPLPASGPATRQHAAGRRWAGASLDRVASTSSPLAALLAGWWLTLADWLGRDDLALGTTFALRPAALRDVFGPAFQYVPLAPDIPRAAPLDRALRAAHVHLRGAMRRAWLPLSAYERAGDVALGLNANLNYYDMDRLPGGELFAPFRRGEGVRVGDVTLREWALPEQDVVRPYDLNLAIFRLDGRLAASLRYRPDLLDRAGAEALLDALAGRLGLEAG